MVDIKCHSLSPSQLRQPINNVLTDELTSHNIKATTSFITLLLKQGTDINTVDYSNITTTKCYDRCGEIMKVMAGQRFEVLVVNVDWR